MAAFALVLGLVPITFWVVLAVEVASILPKERSDLAFASIGVLLAIAPAALAGAVVVVGGAMLLRLVFAGQIVLTVGVTAVILVGAIFAILFGNVAFEPESQGGSLKDTWLVYGALIYWLLHVPLVAAVWRLPRRS